MSDSCQVPLVSVVIPVRNDPERLRSCLRHLQASRFRDFEIVVVDDGSTDATREAAEELGVRLIPLGRQSGPAAARNRGVQSSRGAYIVFLDADVCVHPDTLDRLIGTLTSNGGVAAVFGSYDAQPQAPNVVSQYRNLLHHFVHQTSAAQASTFWSGCGAIKRSVFEQAGGFDTAFGRPCIEDIELGQRLRAAGQQIVLEKTAQVTHLKRWTLWSTLKTDICDRGVPWTQVILQHRTLPNTLNLRVSQRLSVLLACCLLAILPWGVWELPVLAALLVAMLLGISAIDSWPGRRSVPAVGGLFWVATAFITLGVIGDHFRLWTLLPLALVSGIVLANADFYRFLMRERGLLFAAVALPVHILYFWSCGVSFALGTGLFHWQNVVSGRARKSPVIQSAGPMHAPGELARFPVSGAAAYGDSGVSVGT